MGERDHVEDIGDLAGMLDRARARGDRALDEPTGKRLLQRFGIRTPRSVVVTRPQQVDDALGPLRAPFAVKVVSPDILHKSDAGGVALRLRSAQDVAAAIDAMRRAPGIAGARIEGFLVEEMAEAGQEIVVGAVRDPDFGPMVMVGLGGIFVEVLADVAFRICPIERRDAEDMLAELKGAALLAGARGRAPVDRGAIVDALLAIGGEHGLLAAAPDEIAEIDVNPLIASPSGAVAVDARVVLAARAPTTAAGGDGQNATPAAPTAAAAPAADVLGRFGPLLEPRTVAVVGASTKGDALPNVFIRRIRDMGFDGAIYPIHPTAAAIDGAPAYRTLADTPEPVDYAYVAVAAAQVPDMLAQAAGRVRFAQVVSSGFGELDAGKALQDRLARAAREGGMRLLGPTCLGLYTPRGRITFSEGSPREVGTVAVASQSGGLGSDIIRRGMGRGLRFSALVTVGNCVDVGPAEMLELFLADPQTRVIGFYIESARDGRRLFELLRGAGARKPVVMLKGGRSRQGLAAAASHTGALAGDARAWTALSRQTGCVLVDTLDQFLGALLAFQSLTPRTAGPTRRVALFGNGGGTSVLATDYFSGLGLDVEPFGPDAVAALDALRLPPGSSVTNPVDCPVTTLMQDEGRVAERILDLIHEHGGPDALVMHLNMSVFAGRARPEVLDNLVASALRVRERHAGRTHFVLVLRSDGEPGVEARKSEFRAKAVALGVPVYDEMSDAGHALAALAAHERFRSARSADADH